MRLKENFNFQLNVIKFHFHQIQMLRTMDKEGIVGGLRLSRCEIDRKAFEGEFEI